MKVHIYPADIGGCGYYRLIWPALALNSQGLDVEVFLPDTDAANIQALMRVENGVEVVAGVAETDADVIVLQRPMTRQLVDCIPYLQSNNVLVVVEIDDDFRSISPRNLAWKASQPSLNPDRNWKHLDRACELADLVTVSTPELAGVYGKHGRVCVLPNYVPEAYLSINGTGNGPDTFIGWSGSVATHPDDLQIVGPSVANVIRKTDAQIAIVGTGVGVHKRFGLSKTTLVRTTGWLGLASYPYAMAQLDVGMVPLELTHFNHAKSWLKGLEFAALGVPFVASPTRPYLQLMETYGIGNIAYNNKMWERTLIALAQSADYRQTIADSGRRQIERHDLTIERRCAEWAMAWANSWKGRNERLVS